MERKPYVPKLFRRRHSLVPKDSRIVEAVELLKQNVRTQVLAKKYNVSIQTVDRWYFRWVVFPEWVIIKESIDPNLASALYRIEQLKQFIRNHYGVEVDI